MQTHDLILKEILKFQLKCDMQTERRLQLENQMLYLFMRTIWVQYGDSTVDSDLDEHDDSLKTTFDYLAATFRLLY